MWNRMLAPWVAVQQRTIYKREESTFSSAASPGSYTVFSRPPGGNFSAMTQTGNLFSVADPAPSKACLSRTMAIVMSALNRRRARNCAAGTGTGPGGSASSPAAAVGS
jgi:hypothetical protein